MRREERGAPAASDAAGGKAGTGEGAPQFRVPHVAALGALVAALAGVAGVLAALGRKDPAQAVACAVAGLVLLGLVVALNALLRTEGLGGEGLSGAAGVLGAALVALGGMAVAVRAEVQPDPSNGVAVLEALGHTGWLLLALWAGRSGWALARLLAPSRLLAWGSLAVAAAMAGLVLADLLDWPASGAPLAQGRLGFLPFAAWAAGVGAACARGQTPPSEPPLE